MVEDNTAPENIKPNEAVQPLTNALKDELKSHGVQIYENNHLEIKDYIISAIHDSINTCDLLIAFIIDNNLNVYYDVGYAMSKGKKVLIVLIIAKYLPT